MRLVASAFAFVLGITNLVGCGSDDSHSGGGGASTSFVTLTGSIVNEFLAPYPGATLCVDGQPARCAISGQDGNVSLELPANALTGTTMEEPDAFPIFSPVATGDADIAMAGRTWSNFAASAVAPYSLVATTYGSAGVTLDASKGQADFIAVDLNGGTVTMVDGTAQAQLYNAAGTVGIVDAPLAPGAAQLVGFANIDPGTVTFLAKKNGEACEWDPLVWPGEEPGTVTVPIRAGWWTRLLEVKCP